MPSPRRNPDPDATRRRRLLAAAALVVILLLGLLTAQLTVLLKQKSIVRAQLASQRELVNPTVPLIRSVKPLVRTASRAQLERTAQLTRAALAQATPLARSLNERNAPEAIATTAVLARRLLETDAISRGTRAGEETLRLVHRLLAITSTSLAVQRQSLATQRQSLDIQRRTFALLTQSLGVQQETLTHARSIDDKFGGTAPTSGPPVPTP